MKHILSGMYPPLVSKGISEGFIIAGSLAEIMGEELKMFERSAAEGKATRERNLQTGNVWTI